MCDCFKKIEEKLKEHTGDRYARLNHVLYLSRDGAAKKPIVEGIYHKRKKDGTFCKEESVLQVSYEYCPFCGKKLEEE